VKNPFRSEAEAYRFVIGTAAYFLAIALATALGGRWWGLGVFVVASVVALWLFFRRGAKEKPPVVVPTQGAGDPLRRILVVANETVAGTKLRDAIRAAAGDANAQVLVITPALNSPLRHWTSDEDNARAAAEERLARSVGELERLGIDARGEVGDADPVLAIEDALRTFGADVIIISTHPEGRSNWLERGVVANARERFAVPIEHVVVDLDAEAAKAAT
jgi:membrane protein implicated in regulation of membrane protease activity